MPMTQADIKTFYEKEWPPVFAKGEEAHNYCSPVDPLVSEPLYARFLRDERVRVDGGKVLDVGCGSGRWFHFFLEHFAPALIVGLDFAEASIAGLRQAYASGARSELRFVLGDVTAPELELGEQFDLINIANVLFHVPEDDKFDRALANLARHLAPAGVIASTEYLPEITYRTEMMKVRSRMEFEARCGRAGLVPCAMRASHFFCGHSFGTTDERQRLPLLAAYERIHLVLARLDEHGQALLVPIFASLEQATLDYLATRLPATQFPSQKLVLLRRQDAPAAPAPTPGAPAA